MSKKPIPEILPFEEIKPYVETGVEIPKSTLLSRIAGKINYERFILVKMFRFYSISKDAEGNLYFVA